MLEMKLCRDRESADTYKKLDINETYLFRTITEEPEIKLNT